uniref:Sulfite oxidase-like oxidoreductase n=1 Tax=Desulfovibrio sp. U5L TaxID=596152 RepID=I2Q5Z2_9BACT
MGGVTRRWMLRLLAAGVVLGRFPGRALAWVGSRFPVRTVEIEDFGFDAASGVVTRAGGGEPYGLILDGLVAAPQCLPYAGLRALPQAAQTSDFHCVEGWDVPDVPWSGLRIATLAGLARPLPEARYVVFHALGRTRSRPGGLDHYVECLPLADLVNPDLGYLLALDLDGAPLPLEHGAPLRLVCPFDLAYKGAKFVTRLEFAAAPVDGWWTRANGIYEAHAPVEPDRLRRPDPRAPR